MEIFYVVVIYNKECSNSITCRQLRDLKVSNVIIIDNSEKDNHNAQICKELTWNYISMNGNKGISKAYNIAIDFLKDIDKNDLIVWLDDDTSITIEYICLLTEIALQNQTTNIFLPIVKDNFEKIISPTIYTKWKSIKIKNDTDASKIEQKKLLGINTCLAVRKKVYINYRYNENLFLDLVDNQFFYDMRGKEKIQVIPTVIKQNFFSSQNHDYNKEIKRKKILIKDYRKFAEDKSLIEKMMSFFRIFFWGIRGVFKYKKINFIVEILKK